MDIQTNLALHTQTITIPRPELVALIRNGSWRRIVGSLKDCKRFEGTKITIRRV